MYRDSWKTCSGEFPSNAIYPHFSHDPQYYRHAVRCALSLLLAPGPSNLSDLVKSPRSDLSSALSHPGPIILELLRCSFVYFVNPGLKGAKRWYTSFTFLGRVSKSKIVYCISLYILYCSLCFSVSPVPSDNSSHRESVHQEMPRPCHAGIQCSWTQPKHMLMLRIPSIKLCHATE